MRTLLIRSFLVFFLVVGVLIATSSYIYAKPKQYSLRLAHVFPIAPGMPPTAASIKYAEAVRKDSNGRINIEIHGGGVLGGERAIGEQVGLGAIQMAVVGVATAAHLSKQLSIDELPYVWDSWDHALQAYNGELGKIIKSIMLNHGIRPLTFWPFGFRHLTNSIRPVRVPKDIVGLKLRVSQVPLRMDVFRQLGAQVVPMAFPELFTALQQGTVDGQENPLSLIRDSRFFEVQRHLSLTGHIGSTTQVIINESYYQSLPSDLQQILSYNAMKLQDYIVSLITKNDKLALETLRKEGMIIVEDPDKEAFRKALQPVYKKWEKIFQPDLWAAIKKYTFLGGR